MSKKVHLAITGGGTEAIGRLLNKGGASDFFVGATVPYDSHQLDRLILGRSEKYCSQETAEKMALASYTIAKADNPTCEDLLGVGVTASLEKANQREGRVNEAYICFQHNNTTYNWHIDLTGTPGRVQQEFNLGMYIYAKVMMWREHGLFVDYDSAVDVDPALMLIYDNRVRRADFFTKVAVGQPYCLFPGSFNPPHNGHVELAKQAFKYTGFPVVFEISTVNWEKSLIAPVDLQNRINNFAQFQDEPWFGGVVGSQNKRIDRKIHDMTPEFVIVGQDTALRLLRDLNKFKCRELIEICSRFQTQFLVFDRAGWYDAYREELDIVRKNILEDDEPIVTNVDFDRLFVDMKQEVYTDDGISSSKVRLMQLS